MNRMSEQLDYTKKRDLRPALAFFRGDFSVLRKNASNVREAIAYLDEVKSEVEKGQFRKIFLKEGVHRGFSAFLGARDVSAFLRGLIATLRDAGYRKGDISEYLLGTNAKNGEPDIKNEAIADLVKSLFSEKSEI